MYVNASIQIYALFVVLCADGERVEEGQAYRFLRHVSAAWYRKVQYEKLFKLITVLLC